MPSSVSTQFRTQVFRDGESPLLGFAEEKGALQDTPIIRELRFRLSHTLAAQWKHIAGGEVLITSLSPGVIGSTIYSEDPWLVVIEGENENENEVVAFQRVGEVFVAFNPAKEVTQPVLNQLLDQASNTHFYIFLTPPEDAGDVLELPWTADCAFVVQS